MEPLIDLIPQEERTKRLKEKTKKAGLIFSVVFLILSLISAGVIYLYVKSIDDKVTSKKKTVDSKIEKITEKASIEVSARNLDAKYKILSNELTSRLYYSLLLEELTTRVPKTVSINSIDTSTPELLSLTGVATDYISLAKFLNALGDPKVSTSSTNTAENNMFKEVSINTVSLDPLSSLARFNLTISVNPELLKRD